jgi:hypothetical protein
VNGRILSNFYAAKGYTVWDALTRGRTNAAVIMIEWSARSPDDFERSREQVLDFADAMMPLLRQSLRPQHTAHGEGSP